MQQPLDELRTQPYFLPNHPIPLTAFTARPGRVICDAYPERNRRCCRRATTRLTLLTATDCITVVRCAACAEELRERERAGATFEIIADSLINSEPERSYP